MRTSVALIGVLLASTVLAGCTTQDLNSLVYEPIPPTKPKPPELSWLDKNVVCGANDPAKIKNCEHLELMLNSALDDNELAVDVWKPAKNGTYPVIVVISPYFEGTKSPDSHFPGDSSYADWINLFVGRGYAFALADLRGTRMSDGCLDLGGPGEQADAKYIVDYLGSQSWSNGKVGMIGGSYDGWTQLMAAANQPEHLAAIIPIAPVSDLYVVLGKGGAKFEGWVPYTQILYNMAISNGWGFAGPPVQPGKPVPNVYVPVPYVPQPGERRWDRLDDQYPCIVENAVMADDLTGDKNAWFQERDLVPKAKDAKAPMLLIHGFVDVNARPDGIDPWYANYGGPKRAFLWQMDHALPDQGNHNRDDYTDRLIIKWMDYHLKDYKYGFIDEQYNPVSPYGVVEVQDNFGRWRYEADYPPKDANQTSLYLGPGKLSFEKASSGEEIWRDNVYEDGHEFGFKTGRMETTASDVRLVYQSPLLTEDLHYAGRPVVKAFAQTTAPNSYVVVRLYDIAPDGSWTLLNRGVQSFRHRDGVENPQPVVPLTTYEINAAMQPNDFVFPKGHAIGLTITSSDYSYILPSGTNAVNKILYGTEKSSALILPTIQRNAFFDCSWGGNQPAWMGLETRPDQAALREECPQ